VTDLLAALPPPPWWVVAATGLAAAAAVVLRPSWRVLRHVVTIAHEGGHAAVAAAAGRRLRGVRLHSDTSGVSVSSGRAGGPGVVMTLLAGYLTPSVLGLAAAAAAGAGFARPTLWGAVVLLALLLLQVRNLFGVVSVAVTGAVLVGVALWTEATAQSAAAYALAWFLLLAAPRPVLELQRRRRRRVPDSDADQLARLTRLPALVWVALFLVATVAAAVLGARWLVPPTTP
jgi:hypothetical protein